MTTFLLVPGSHHGGWWYADLVAALTSSGHTAVAVTLEGLDPDAAPPEHSVNLGDHVTQAIGILDAIDSHEPPDTVLVGHSYGGSIISAMADARSERVRALVYLDALLPEDGDSSWSMTNDDEHQWYISGAERTGTFVDVLPFFDPRARPHPLATLMQASVLTGAWRRVPVKHYVRATAWPGESPMAAMSARADADATIIVHDWDTTHNVLKDGPGRVLELISDL